MSWLKSLFSADTIIETAAKGAYNGIDMAIFTDEERSIAQQKTQDWLIEYHKATLPQNLSRRYIVVMVIALWGTLVLGATILNIVGLTEKSQFVFKVLKEIVMQPFSIIIGFYFIGHALGKVVGK